MELDQRLFNTFRRSRENVPYLDTFNTYYYPHEISEALVEEIHNASEFISEQWWKEVDERLVEAYDYYDRNKQNKKYFLTIGVVKATESLDIFITHSPNPNEEEREIKSNLNLVFAPWSYDPQRENYILLLYKSTELPVFLIRHVDARRKKILVAASYKSACRGLSPRHNYDIKRISNMLRYSSIIKEFRPPIGYEPLKKPVRIKFGRRKEIEE